MDAYELEQLRDDIKLLKEIRWKLQDIIKLEKEMQKLSVGGVHKYGNALASLDEKFNELEAYCLLGDDEEYSCNIMDGNFKEWLEEIEDGEE